MKIASDQDSFDSSNDIECSSTNSTHSLPPIETVRTAQLQDYFKIDGLFPKMPQLDNQIKGCNQSNPIESFFSLGFRNGCGNRAIEINQSKLKKAKKFFEDTQPMPAQEQFSMIMMDFAKEFGQQGAENDNEQINSLPCFKTVGKGLEIKVSQAARVKAQQMLKGKSSLRKSTKIKNNTILNSESMVKTKINNEEEREKKIEKKIFDWQKYMKTIKYEYQVNKQANNHQKCSKSNVRQHKSFIFIKLADLPIHFQSDTALSNELQKRTISIDAIKFNHSKECSLRNCILCKLQIFTEEINKMGLFQIMTKHLSKSKTLEQAFRIIFNEIVFKLIKYSIYWPEVSNKAFEASNVIVQVNKKLIRYQKQEEGSAIINSLTKQQVGKHFNVIVKKKFISQKIEGVFLLLSDGWSSIWAFIEPTNLLYDYMLHNKKVRVGTKLSICCWRIHPISNILTYCKDANPNEICIEFFFNGSIILNLNAKLGIPQYYFYRPLDKCRYKGGLVYLVDGTVIRIFSPKERAKKQSNNLSAHYIQILTPEGISCHIKFILNEENSLVEYFRLYHSYRFFKLKINDDKMLTFVSNQSKFEQNKNMTNLKNHDYPQELLLLIKKRLINSQKAVQDAEVNQLYDFINAKGQMVWKEKKLINVTILNEIQSGDVSLYQQFLLISKEDNRLIFSRAKLSSQLRKIPKIYEV